MLSRSVRAAMVLVAMACLSLGFSAAVRAVGPPSHTDRNTDAFASTAAIVYSQPPIPGGGLYQSSRNGSDFDRYVWDGFTLPSSHPITEIQWRGGYDPASFGSGGPVLDFAVAIYPSAPGGSQPDVINPPLVHYQTGGNAGETPAGPSGNIAMYDYSFALPTPFQAIGGTKYWVQIEASQGGIPDWGVAWGTGGDGTHFLGIPVVGDMSYHTVPGDAAFALVGPIQGSTNTPTATATATATGTATPTTTPTATPTGTASSVRCYLPMVMRY